MRDFSLRILRHQPAAYAEAVLRDFGYGFSPVRGAGPERYSPAYLQFQTTVRPDRQAYASIGKLGYPAPQIRAGPAAFLAAYGRWFYLPGPLFAAGLVLALGGLVFGRGDRKALLLFTASAVAVLLPPALFATFDWRYQLPQLSLIPVAAVLGADAIGRRLFSQAGAIRQPARSRSGQPLSAHPLTITGRRGGREATPVQAPGRSGAGWQAVRHHCFFLLVLTAGLALRVLAETAYRPALLYIDSVKYLEGSVATAPQGYQALLRLLEPVGGLALVAAVQHVFGLAMAVALYALLLRRGAPRWAATLAAAPVLLDAYQLQLEQTIMPDVLFETMITAGLVVLLWRRRPGHGRWRRARWCSVPPSPCGRSARC